MPGRRNFIRCKLTNIEFFVDTGASLSSLPNSLCIKKNYILAKDRVTQVQVADGRAMPIYGYCVLEVDFGISPKEWKFYAADVRFPIVGRDFFLKFELLIDTDA